MQKKLIALAVAGLASTAAFAQVTIYGVADATFDSVKVSSSTVSTNDTPSFSRISTNSSLLGFKGTEDLGSGMNAVYQYESSINFDATGGALAARDSYVGLTGGFGKVLLGNLTGPTRGLGASVDVYSGATGIGANAALIGKVAQGHGTNDANSTITTNASCVTRSATCASIFDNRWKNSIAYVSPALGPVTVTGVYVANENQTTYAGTTVSTRGFDLGATFNQGPVMVGLTRNWATLGDTAETKAAVTRLVGKFSFGVGDVRALYDSVTMKDVVSVDLKRTIMGVGATFMVGSGKIVGQYYKSGDQKSNGTKVDDSGATLTSVGYEHSLSKRTLVKVLYSRVSNDEAANFDYGVNATGLGAAGATISGFSAGLRHSF
jgi:predicted porin